MGNIANVHPFPFDEHGILLRRRAIEVGLDDNWLWRQRRAGVIVRMRQGAYVGSHVWAASTRSERHLLTSRAVLQQYDDRVALSHASGHLVRGGPDYGLDLRNVHLTNLYGRGDRLQAGITHHHGTVRVGDVTRWEDFWITADARTAVETAAGVPHEVAVCVLDWWLHRGSVTRAELELQVLELMREWPGTAFLSQALAESDGRSESVGESRSRLLARRAGFDPVPQYEVRDPRGRLVAIVDLALPDHGVLIEFDGQVKYGRLLKPGQTVNDVVLAERSREKQVQELTDMSMIRWVWGDLERPHRTMARLVDAVARRTRRGSSA